MDSLEINKIVGAILTASVIAMVSGFIADLTFPRSQPAKAVYALEADESGEAVAETAAPGLEPIGPLLASADAASGQAVAKKCVTCHTFDEGGKNKIGPNLWNVVDRTIGAQDGFSFSKALTEMASESWTYEDLNAFLAKPKDWAPGTKMSFAGLKKAQDRANLILYLRSLSGSPADLPEG